jgi:subtilisin family serine protease
MLKKFFATASLCLFACAMQAQSSKTYIILANGTGAGSTRSLVANLGSSLVAQYDEAGVVVAQSSDPNFATWAAAQPGVSQVAEDQVINWLPSNETAIANTQDPPTASSYPPINHQFFQPLQWNLHQIHADQTAANGDVGNGVARARVAILDAGVVTTHPDIAPNLNLTLSKSFVPGEAIDPPADGSFNHGTHVAGIVAAIGLGTQGVAPQAELVAVKVLSAKTGSGPFSQIIAGIEYASSPAVHADIINMSLGATFNRNNAGGGGLGTLISALNRVITHAEQRGTLVVSAAGNNGVNLNGQLWSIPAQSGNGMAVSATGPLDFGQLGFSAPFDRLASYSNFGQSVVNVAAPGGEYDASLANSGATCTVGPEKGAPCYLFDFVISPGAWADLGGGQFHYLYYFAIGTSMATPHVSGEAALLVGKYGHIGPAALQQMIQNSADNIGSTAFFGRGRINALAALQ